MFGVFLLEPGPHEGEMSESGASFIHVECYSSVDNGTCGRSGEQIVGT